LERKLCKEKHSLYKSSGEVWITSPLLCFLYARRNYGVFLVDLAGVEPASESPSIKASPITVIILTFPPSAA